MRVDNLYKDKDEKLFAEVQKLKDGDFSGYDNIYKLSEKYIYKIINDIVKNHHTTEDLMQDAYIQIYNKIGTLQEAKAFYVWAGRIATNLTLRHLQKSNRIKTVEFPNRDEGDNPDFPYNKASMDHEEFIPEAVLVDREKQRLLAEILDNLSTEQKLSVQYFYYEEMSVNEIAELMGCSTGTVKSRLNYARKSIKDAVIDLDVKHGTRLYSLSTLPLFWFIFRNQLEQLIVGGLAAEGFGLAKALGGASGGISAEAGAGSAQAVGMASGGVNVAGGSAVQAAGGSAAVSGGMEAAGGAVVAESAVASGSVAASSVAAAGSVSAATGAGTAAGLGGSLAIKAGIIVCTATVGLGGMSAAVSQTSREIETGVYTRYQTMVESESQSFWSEILAMDTESIVEEPEVPQESSDVSEQEIQKIKDTYANVIDGYTNMGISEEEVVTSLLGAEDYRTEMYQELDEFFAAYNNLKQAYRNVLSAEQYAVAENKLLADADMAMAQQSIGTEDFLSWMAENPNDPDMQTLFDKQIAILDVTIAATYASADFLNHPLSAQIMSNYTASDVSSAIEQGYNVPMLVQLYLMEYNDGTYNDLVDPNNRLADLSQQTISVMEEYANFVSSNTRIQQLSEEHAQNMSPETQAYYQQLVQYYSELMQ